MNTESTILICQHCCSVFFTMLNIYQTHIYTVYTDIDPITIYFINTILKTILLCNITYWKNKTKMHGCFFSRYPKSCKLLLTNLYNIFMQNYYNFFFNFCHFTFVSFQKKMCCYIWFFFVNYYKYYIQLMVWLFKNNVL